MAKKYIYELKKNMQINSTNQNFGSALTVRNIFLDGKPIYTKYASRMIGGSEQEIYVKAVMKSLRLNLKERIDTPAARKLNEIVPDFYYKLGKKTDVLYLPECNRGVNLLTGAEAFTIENINNNKGLNRRQKRNYIAKAISDMFDVSEKSKGIFAGLIDVFASTRNMVEKDGKKLYELIAIDDITKAL